MTSRLNGCEVSCPICYNRTTPATIYFMNFIRMNRPILQLFFFMHWVHGALRKDFMMCCGIHDFLLPRVSFSETIPFDSGMISYFINRQRPAALWHGTRIIHTGQEL